MTQLITRLLDAAQTIEMPLYKEEVSTIREAAQKVSELLTAIKGLRNAKTQLEMANAIGVADRLIKELDK